MRCGKVRKKLMAYHDEELSRTGRGRVEKHLNACPGCSGMLGDLIRADSAASLPGSGPEYWDSFTDRVMARVRGEPTPARMGRKKTGEKPGPAFLRFVPALSVALVFVVAVGLYIGSRVELPTLKVPMPPVRQDKLETNTGIDRNEALGEGVVELEKKRTVQGVKQGPVFEEQNDESRPPSPSASEITISDEVAGEARYQAKAASGIGAPALYARAESAFRAGDLSGAEVLLRRLLAVYPADQLGGKTAVLLARVLARQDRPYEAEKVLSEGERMFPGDPDIARFRGERETTR